MIVRQREPAGLDRIVDTWYRQHRTRYMYGLFALSTLLVHILVPVLVPVFGPLFSHHVSDWPTVLWVMEVAALLGVPPWWLIFRHAHRSAIAFTRGDAAADVELIWTNSVIALPRLVLFTGFVYAVPLFGAALYLCRRMAAPALAYPVAIAGMTIAVTGVLVIQYLMWAVALRPIVREIADRLPPGLLADRPGHSLRNKLLVLLLSTTVFNGFAAASLSTLAWGHENRIAAALVGTIILAATLSGLIVWLVRYEFLSRLAELQEAMRQVQGGQPKPPRLPPLAGDELDVLGHSFNTMVERLGQYESEMDATRARIATVATEERRRLERDLHDGVQQYMALLRLQLTQIQSSHAVDGETATRLAAAMETLDAAGRELRALSHGIYPAILEADGLVGALKDAAKRATVPTTVAGTVGRLTREREAAVYYCCLEALQNASKHAGSTATATIELVHNDGTLEFTIADDGIGFAESGEGSGLLNMRDRIAAFGGQVDVESWPGVGTRVSGRLPLA